MAKALFGHVGLGSDLRQAAEVRRLQLRVHELEAELDRSCERYERLVSSLTVDDDMIRLSLSDPEPALTR